MKQITLLLLLILACTSCIYTDEECPGYMRFTFLHQDALGGYDEAIRNDIHLRIYKDNMLYSAGIVSYEEIKGGKEYRIKKEVTGEIDIVAWAVPHGEEFIAEIPGVAADETRRGETLSMTPSTKAAQTFNSIGHVYLGRQTRIEKSLLEDSRYPVTMNSCISEFTSTLHNLPEIYTPGQDEEVWMIISGIKSEMDADFHPKGEDAAVRAEFTEKTAGGTLSTGKYGLLPSAEGQYIQVDVYRADIYQGTVKTEIQAEPGKKIHLDIYRNTVSISINGWKVIETQVEWI